MGVLKALIENGADLDRQELPDETMLARLGRKIKSLNNIKLKTILLRAIHGDIYCATRMKKFGMMESDECQRCGLPETIDHLLFSCQYTKCLWKNVEKVTHIKNESLAIILGCSDIHDKTTLTLHSELIRILLAIDRPTKPPNEILKNTLTRLSIIERGVTQYQINQMIKLNET